MDGWERTDSECLCSGRLLAREPGPKSKKPRELATIKILAIQRKDTRPLLGREQCPDASPGLLPLSRRLVYVGAEASWSLRAGFICSLGATQRKHDLIQRPHPCKRMQTKIPEA